MTEPGSNITFTPGRAATADLPPYTPPPPIRGSFTPHGDTSFDSLQGLTPSPTCPGPDHRDSPVVVRPLRLDLAETAPPGPAAQPAFEPARQADAATRRLFLNADMAQCLLSPSTLSPRHLTPEEVGVSEKRTLPCVAPPRKKKGPPPRLNVPRKVCPGVGLSCGPSCPEDALRAPVDVARLVSPPGALAAPAAAAPAPPATATLDKPPVEKKQWAGPPRIVVQRHPPSSPMVAPAAGAECATPRAQVLLGAAPNPAMLATPSRGPDQQSEKPFDPSPLRSQLFSSPSQPSTIQRSAKTTPERPEDSPGEAAKQPVPKAATRSSQARRALSDSFASHPIDPLGSLPPAIKTGTVIAQGGQAVVTEGTFTDPTTGKIHAIAIKTYFGAMPQSLPNELRMRDSSVSDSVACKPIFVRESQQPTVVIYPRAWGSLERIKPVIRSWLADESSALWETKRVLIAYIMTKFLRALAKLHKGCQTAHNDGKPANALLEEDGSLKLCDWGSIGHTGPLLGTQNYMGPESSERTLVDGAYSLYKAARTGQTDLHAFGATILQLMFGQSPFELFPGLDFTFYWDGERHCERYEALRSDPAATIKEEARPLAQEMTPLLSILMDCLHPDMDKRPKVQDALTAVLRIRGQGPEWQDRLKPEMEGIVRMLIERADRARTAS